MSGEPSEDPVMAVLRRMEATIDDVHAGLGIVRTELTGRIETLESAVSAEPRSMRAGLSEEIGGLRTDLTARMERLEDKLTTIRDDMTTNARKLEAAVLALVARSPL